VRPPLTDARAGRCAGALSYDPGRTDQAEGVRDLTERAPKTAAPSNNKARSRAKPAAAAATLESMKELARENEALKKRLASLERGGGGAAMPRRMGIGNGHNASLRRTRPPTPGSPPL
jgi:hypothetical protein